MSSTRYTNETVAFLLEDEFWKRDSGSEPQLTKAVSSYAEFCNTPLLADLFPSTKSTEPYLVTEVCRKELNS